MTDSKMKSNLMRSIIAIAMGLVAGLTTLPASAVQNYTATPLAPGGLVNFGYGINASGQVTGRAYADTISDFHAFLYSGGTMQDLGTLGGTQSFGYGINASGQVTGQASLPVTGAFHAFLYSGGTMYDLNSLVVSGLAGETLVTAIGINDSGQIVANNCNGPTDLNCKAYRLDPVASPAVAIAVPTASNWALSATGILLLGAGLLRRRAITRHAAPRDESYKSDS